MDKVEEMAIDLSESIVEVWNEKWNRYVFDCKATAEIMIKEEGYCKQVHGEWLPDETSGHLMKCSICDYYEYESMAKGDFRKFCPNCGAKMKGNN